MTTVVEPDDPSRCQGMMSSGQCTLQSLPGLTFCKLHAASAKRVEAKENIRNLNVAVWQRRIGELADSPQAKSLREEIGVLRLLLEAVLNTCQDNNQLIAMSNKISDLVSRIEKVVGSCHNLEKASGRLLDKSAALQLATAFIDIVGNHCSNPDEVAIIADRLVEEVAKIKSVPDSKG